MQFVKKIDDSSIGSIYPLGKPCFLAPWRCHGVAGMPYGAKRIGMSELQILSQ